MKGFAKFVEQDINENMWRNLGAGAALLGAGLGTGYALKGGQTSKPTNVSIPSVSAEVDRPMLQNMDYDELVRDYQISHQNDPQYKSTFGKNRLRTDAQFFAAKYLRDKAGTPKNTPFNFTTQQGKVVNPSPDKEKEIERKSGSVDD